MSNIQSAAGGGIVSPSGSLYLNNNQLNLVSGSGTLVLLDAIASGFSDGIENVVTHRIYPGVAGLYLIDAGIMFTSVVALKPYRMIVTKNDSTWIGVYGHSGLVYNMSLTLSKLISLAAPDYIDMWAYSYADVDTVGISKYKDATFLTIQRVR